MPELIPKCGRTIALLTQKSKIKLKYQTFEFHALVCSWTGIGTFVVIHGYLDTDSLNLFVVSELLLLSLRWLCICINLDLYRFTCLLHYTGSIGFVCAHGRIFLPAWVSAVLFILWASLGFARLLHINRVLFWCIL